MLTSTKRFTLTSEAVNSFGFKVSTKGILLKDFLNNPLMLWMHKRAGGSKNDVLPLGYWDKIRVENDTISAVPVFDDKDSFSVSIYNKVENGIIRMASAGLKPIAWTEEKNIKVLSASILQEASLVDIGSNSEALAVALYDEQGKLITLSDSAFKISISTSTSHTLNSPFLQINAGKSWNELWHSGELETLKLNHPHLYNLKFKEQFGRLPKS